MDDLKVYLENEEDQQTIVDFILDRYQDVKITTWEPDYWEGREKEAGGPGCWGLFIDNVSENIWPILIERYGPRRTRLIGKIEMSWENEGGKDWKSREYIDGKEKIS